MSNQLVGAIYQRIISDVIEASQVDFEEGGVDSSTLDEMKQVWQEKLSSIGVATFPWDPPPAPPQITNPATLPSNAPPTGRPTTLPSTTTPSPSSGNTPGSKANNAASGSQVSIKTEPGVENVPVQPTGNPGLGNPQAAAIAVQRAASLMQQKFGSQANNSIGSLQSSNLALPPTTRPPQNQQPQQSQSKDQQKNGAAAPHQTDGSTDDSSESWNMIMKTRNAHGADETVRLEADVTIRQHVLAMGQEMEGGGLMLTLRERVKPAGAASIKKKRKLTLPILPSNPVPGSSASASAAPVPSTSAGVPQVDGGLDSDSDDAVKNEPAPGLFDDEEVDEDAINSDLDDPDENVDQDQDDDESMTQIMLCMYDKVQRVKNKWKCTLKDGVLTVNGREYVFHKATGEFEW